MKCIKPLSGLDDVAKYGMSAIAGVGAAAFIASGCIATAGGCAATFPLLGKVAGGLVLKGTASAASSAKAGLEFLDQQFSGSDDVIVKVNGVQVLPTPNFECRGAYYEKTGKGSTKVIHRMSKAGDMRACIIKAGETISGKTSFSFRNTATIQLLEHDARSDSDDLGWLRVDPKLTVGGEQVIIFSDAEGTVYSISFHVTLGGGEKSKIPEFLACGTVDCRPCAGASCRDADGLDRDGDKEDLKKCPESYAHHRYEKFDMYWPFADVFLNICKHIT